MNHIRRINGLIIALIILFGYNELLYAQPSDWIAPEFANTLDNPFKGDKVSIKEGKKLFNTICFACHGIGGKGDGVAAAGLNKPPADLTSSMVQQQSDGALFWKISEGNPPMLSFKSSLSEEQRWKIINYVRQLNSGQKEKAIGKIESLLKKEKQPVKKVNTTIIETSDEKVFNPYAVVEDEQKGNLIADQQVINKTRGLILPAIKHPEIEQSKKYLSDTMSYITAFWILVLGAIIIIIIYFILIVKINRFMNYIINNNNK